MLDHGTKPGAAMPEVTARLLDLTRLVSRAGRVPTGVDRVELAYLRALTQNSVACFGIVRTTLGYVLLDRDGMLALTARLAGREDWGSADVLSLLARSKTVDVRKAESDLRRVALARCRPMRLAKMLRTHLPRGFGYLNVGHSNLRRQIFDAVKSAGARQSTVLIHDVIPLDYPEFQRAGTPAKFRARLKVVAAKADVIIYNSRHSRQQAERIMSDWGDVPTGVVAHLGVTPVQPDQRKIPENLDLRKPYFVTVGTIEPRKNHALLLDVWEELAKTRPTQHMPQLVICGARGWNNEEVFRRLDALPRGGMVIECPGLSDAAVAAVVHGARALLFPSLAEGFGLPPIEAAILGVPVVCLDLPVYRETMGEFPIYVKDPDRYQWCLEIKSLITGPMAEQMEPADEPFQHQSWDDHFNTVLRFT